MFRHDALHHGRIPRKAFVAADPDQLLIHRGEEDTGPIQGAIVVSNPMGGAFNWSATTSGQISVSPTSGMLRAGESASVLVNVNASGFPDGIHDVGEVYFEGLVIGEESEPGYASVSVSVYKGLFDNYRLAFISRR